MNGEVAGILIVEDDAQLQATIRKSVAGFTAPEKLFVASSLFDAKALLRLHQPEVVLLDVGLPDGSGLDLLKYQQDLGLSAKMLILSGFSDEETIVEAIKLGAQGYLLKQDESSELVDAMRLILQGQPPLSPSVAQCIMRHISGNDANSSSGNTDLLPPRQMQTLKLLARGLTYKETASRMGITFHTVSTYAQEIYSKLAASSRAEAVHNARQMGIL